MHGFVIVVSLLSKGYGYIPRGNIKFRLAGGEMYVIELYVDGGRSAAWGCTVAAGPAVLLTRATSADPTTGTEGVELHRNDVNVARRLMTEWALPGDPPGPGTYRPADGMRFLLALYATYCRGSRVWAVARREAGPGPGEDQQ